VAKGMASVATGRDWPRCPEVSISGQGDGLSGYGQVTTTLMIEM
jgi:hypothetical protein